MHETAFADSARPTRVACLRLLLQPYSLGHEAILTQENNPLLILDREEFDKLPAAQQIQALLRAVIICSNTHQENQRPQKWLRLWTWGVGRAAKRTGYWPFQIAEFRNYLETGRTLMPILSQDTQEDAEAYQIANQGQKMEGGRSLGTPLLPQLINFAAERGFTACLAVQTVWDIPFALIGNLYFGHQETEGRITIENAAEFKVRLEMEEFRAQIAAEKAAAVAAWTAAITTEEKTAAIAAHPRILDLFPDACRSRGNETPRRRLNRRIAPTLQLRTNECLMQ